eukprot:TRINITY_DN104437_c0_g1_i1.p1 TRINITY_DN104437_c0_g1~~TRINITY_DN104437_c0_g1_i1.p1  ORF type:complete len:229 (+),score=0.23 TRINITY_DN104437_c0_g1_i1:71-688(+)
MIGTIILTFSMLVTGMAVKCGLPGAPACTYTPWCGTGLRYSVLLAKCLPSTNGDTCVQSADCCGDNVCLGHSCTGATVTNAGTCKGPAGTDCKKDSDCNSGDCTIGTCACVPINKPCYTTLDCCDTVEWHCKNAKTEDGVCVHNSLIRPPKNDTAATTAETNSPVGVRKAASAQKLVDPKSSTAVHLCLSFSVTLACLVLHFYMV